MEYSIFSILGPVMIGPSSSHTAGAARLARVARSIVGKPYNKVEFYLHGSFAQTYKGHGTDRALVAGALGFNESDDRLCTSFAIADEMGLAYSFQPVELEGAHENTVMMKFYQDDKLLSTITAISLSPISTALISSSLENSPPSSSNTGIKRALWERWAPPFWPTGSTLPI